MKYELGMFIVAIVAAGINFILAILAIGGETVRRLFYKPDMILDFNSLFPCCNKTTVLLSRNILIRRKIFSKEFITVEKSCKTFSFKVRIKNIGRRDARNVQVYLAELMYKHQTGLYVPCESFLPMNLMWAYQDNEAHKSSIVSVISPKMERYCDFIFVDKHHCYLRTEVNVPVSDKANNIITPGKYIARLIVSLSDFKSIGYEVEFTYTGKWSKNSEDVIKDIVVRKVKIK